MNPAQTDDKPEYPRKWRLDEREEGDDGYGTYPVVNGEREFRALEKHDATWLVDRLNHIPLLLDQLHAFKREVGQLRAEIERFRINLSDSDTQVQRDLQASSAIRALLQELERSRRAETELAACLAALLMSMNRLDQASPFHWKSAMLVGDDAVKNANALLARIRRP